jgi:hypothetical protein
LGGGSNFRLQGNDDEAEKMYLQSRKKYEKTTEENPTLYALNLVNNFNALSLYRYFFHTQPLVFCHSSSIFLPYICGSWQTV